MGPITANVTDCGRVLDAVRDTLRARSDSRFSCAGVALLGLDEFSKGHWPTFAADAREVFDRIGVPIAAASMPTPREIDRAFASLLASHLELWFEHRIASTAGAALLGLARRPHMHPHTASVLLRLFILRCSIYRDRTRALERVDRVRAAAAENFAAGRLLVSPTTTFPAPPHGKAVFARGIGAFLKLANVIDATAIALPFGRFPGGLPRSLQILGPAGSENAVLELARRVEEQTAR
jgi:Asp-tRNA(Asn)/Glu-tRNA(Gln) amidotransferase A subunit family amidase